jgi:hypothetical protein
LDVVGWSLGIEMEGRVWLGVSGWCDSLEPGALTASVVFAETVPSNFALCYKADTYSA